MIIKAKVCREREMTKTVDSQGQDVSLGHNLVLKVCRLILWKWILIGLGIKTCVGDVGMMGSAEKIIVEPSGEISSLSEALEKVRQLRMSGATGTLTIALKAGDYFVNKSILLESIHSDLLIRAVEGEKVNLIGGVVIKKERLERLTNESTILDLLEPSSAKNIMSLDLSSLSNGELGEISRHGWRMEKKQRVPPAQLYVDGVRMRLARWPNHNVLDPSLVYQHHLKEDRPLNLYEKKVQSILDHTTILGQVGLSKVIDPGHLGAIEGAWSTPSGGGVIAVDFDRMKKWSDLSQIWMDGVFASTWEWSYNQLESIDIEKQHIKLKYPELHGIGEGASVRLPHFHFENILEELDQRGEYYIDRQRKKLYLYPPGDLVELCISTLSEPMLVVDGVEKVRFRGLNFCYGRHLGVEVKKSEQILFENCRIVHFSKGGMDIEGDAVKVRNCELYGLGGFGVKLCGGDRKSLTSSNHEVSDCHIHDFGWDQKSQAAGVMIQSGVGHRVVHNEIHDGTHFAIRLVKTNDVQIEHNEIYDLPKYHKLDGGALYVYNGTRAESRGNRVVGNYFHDIPTIGVYPDNNSLGMVISHNLFVNVGYKTGRAAIHCNGGVDNRTYNNIVVDGALIYEQGARAKDSYWMTQWKKALDRYGEGHVYKTPYRKYPDFLAWLRKKDPDEFYRGRSDVWNNLMYFRNVTPASMDVQYFNERNKRLLTEQAVIDRSNHLKAHQNVVSNHDPGFIQAAKGNYKLSKEASVYQWIKGFETIPFEKMGRRITCSVDEG